MSDPKQEIPPSKPVADAAVPNGPPASDPTEAEHDGESVPDSSPDSAKMRALLKRALAAPPADTGEEILRGVQQKIRKRSRGKFYGDGWSTNQSRVSYALVAASMLFLLALAYWFISPLAVGH